jgi:hypothetical protein
MVINVDGVMRAALDIVDLRAPQTMETSVDRETTDE